MKSPFINIHSHKDISPNNLGIKSLHIQETTIETNFSREFSIGLHPYHILKKNYKEALKNIELLIEQPMLKAVGECGLDRSIAINFDLQKEVFLFQLKLADSHDKPLIVHNVRAFADFFSILKQEKPNIPLLFHAFNGNADILSKLLQFNTFFSFGKDLLNNNSKASRIINKVPINRLFLETDDSDVKIENIYSIAATRIGISIDKLRNQIYYTYNNLVL